MRLHKVNHKVNHKVTYSNVLLEKICTVHRGIVKEYRNEYLRTSLHAIEDVMKEVRQMFDLCDMFI